MSSTNTTTIEKSNPIPPWERIAVDAATAAAMMSCGRSTFFQRVKSGMYPKPGPDGRWSVSALRQLHEQPPEPQPH